MTAHGIAVHLGALLSGAELDYLALTPVEVNELIEALGHALASPDLNASIFGIRMSAKEILLEMNLSMAVSSNRALLLKSSNCLNFILLALKVADTDTLEATVSFVWTIAIASQELKKESPCSDLQLQLSKALPNLEQLSKTNNTRISKMAEYAFLSLQPDLHKSKLFVKSQIFLTECMK